MSSKSRCPDCGRPAPTTNLMRQPAQINETSQADTLPMSGAPANAMSRFAPMPAMPERPVAPAVARRQDQGG